MTATAQPSDTDTSLSPAALEARTQAIGRDLVAAVRRQPEHPAEWLQDRFLLAIAQDELVRTSLLRFVDVLASLDFDTRGTLTARLAREYLSRSAAHVPQPFRLLADMALRAPAPSRLVRLAALTATTTIADRFIVEPGRGGVNGVLAALRREGRVPSFDVLGEHVVGTEEAAAYLQRYLDLIGQLGRHPDAGATTPDGLRRLQVSVKLSALTPLFDPVDPEGTLDRVRAPFEAILDAAVRSGVAVTVDTEEYRLRDLTWFIFQAVFGRAARFGGWPDAGMVVQGYLADARAHVERVLTFARQRGTPFQIRLVKGAYWDYETIVAEAAGWPVPVLQVKAATDVQYERLTERLARAYPTVRPAIGSHNLRSHAHAAAVCEALGLPTYAIEHQTLHGMAPQISRALQRMGWVARDYIPVGGLLAGMSYLVRRILENSSQTGFLLQTRAGARTDELMGNPAVVLAEAEQTQRRDDSNVDSGFRNTPPVRLFVAAERDRFAQAVDRAVAEQGQRFPLLLPPTDEPRPWLRPPNPSAPDPKQPAVQVEAATDADVAEALRRAVAAAPAWAARSLEERGTILRRAAGLLVRERDALGAAMVVEAGKDWAGALGDVDEAADYLRYYPWIAARLGERFATQYRPRGVVAVIPPWNFPLAIPCGMTAAALLTGNVVLLKPAEQTPGITARLVAIFHEAGVPAAVLQHLPGDGERVGGALVRSPAVDMVAFTGSRDVGLRIAEEASGVEVARGGLKHVLAEMGGKNAIAVFPDADLDEAVEGILRSTFGHANQKCSACSRVFAHQAIFAHLRRRLAEGARSLPVGPATDPGIVINPLIDAEAVARVRRRAAEARAEGKVVLDMLEVPGDARYCLGPLLVELAPSVLATARTAQEEIFGPVLMLAPFSSEREALAQINDTAYGLTAGIYSRSPATIRRMVAGIRTGNIYVNRETTGARVGIEPFGGMGMSGTGPKAGGEEYLWGFVTGEVGYRERPSAPSAASDGGTPASLAASHPASAAPPAARPWPLLATWKLAARRRAAVLRIAATRLAAERSTSLRGAGLLLTRLVGQVGEVVEAHPTLTVPGQETVNDWSLPRGVGLVAVDDGAPADSLVALVGAALLAGNGVAVWAAGELTPAAESLAHAFWQAGVPRRSLALLAGGAEPPEPPPGGADFVALDVSLDRAHRLAQSVSRRHPGQRGIPAVLSMVDRPGPSDRGFLQRFASPRTIAMRTLHHGADLGR